MDLHGMNVGQVFTGADGHHYAVVDPGKGIAQPYNDSTWGSSWNGGSGGGGGGSTVQPFAWTNQQWADARAAAIAPGSPLYQYYTQKLAQAQGDVNLAKSYIAEDYQLGKRFYQGSYDAQNTANVGQYQASSAANTATANQETYGAMGEGGAKGYYAGQIPSNQDPNNSQAPTSDYYNKFIGQPLSVQQQSRKAAIDLAYQNQQKQLGLTAQNQLGTDTTGKYGDPMLDSNGKPMEGQLAEAQSKGNTSLESGLVNTQLDLNDQKAKDINTEATNQYTQAQSNYSAAHGAATA